MSIFNTVTPQSLRAILCAVGIFITTLVAAMPAQATIVRLQTTLGNIDIELYDTATPATVTNFLAYVNSAKFNNSFIHRSVPGFIIQGGGFTWDNTASSVATVVKNPPVVNEFSPTRSNVRGTIAIDRKSTRLNSSHSTLSRMPSSA